MALVRRLKKTIREQRGQSFAEFAVTAPILLMLIIGGIFIGLIVYNQIVIITSANQGARLGAALHADENVSPYVATQRARDVASATLSHTAGSCSSIQAMRSGDSFVVDIRCPFQLPIPFMGTETIVLSHRASYYIFE